MIILWLGLATGISNFIDFHEIFIIYVIFDADSKKLRIFEKLPLERAREQSSGAVRKKMVFRVPPGIFSLLPVSGVTRRVMTS